MTLDYPPLYSPARDAAPRKASHVLATARLLILELVASERTRLHMYVWPYQVPNYLGLSGWVVFANSDTV